MTRRIVINEIDLFETNILVARSLLNEAYTDSNVNTKLKKAYLSYHKIKEALQIMGVSEDGK